MGYFLVKELINQVKNYSVDLKIFGYVFNEKTLLQEATGFHNII